MSDRTNLSGGAAGAQGFGGKKSFKIILSGSLLICGFFLAKPSLAQLAQTANLPQPYLMFPNAANYQTGSSLPIITGETANNTTIEVYLDGQPAGLAQVTNGPIVTAYFTFRPSQNLAGGEHLVYVIAKDKNNPELTGQSAEQSFYVWPFPRPTLFPITEYQNGQPIIKGVAKNDSTVRIFADGELQATFPVANHPSGTAAFAWTALEGKSFSATATDPEGKVSALSNVIVASQPIAPQIQKAETKKEIIKEETNNQAITGEETIENEEQETQTEEGITEIGLINKKSFWLWLLLIAIVIAIISWLRKSLKPKPSGEIIAQEPKIEPVKPAPKTDWADNQQEPPIKTPPGQPGQPTSTIPTPPPTLTEPENPNQTKLDNF